MAYGQYTITLQDVAFQLGLHIDRNPVSGCMSSWEYFEGSDIFSLCNGLLGAIPGSEHLIHYFVNCQWFIDTFKLGDNPTQDIIACRARAYIMILFGGFLVPDKLGFKVSLKWLPLLCDFH